MTRRTLLRRIGIAVGAAVIVNVLLVAVSSWYDAVAITLITWCLLALTLALFDGFGVLHPVRWWTEKRIDERPPPTEATLRVYQRLLERHRVAREPDTDLQQRLVALAERRLAQAYGLSRATHSDTDIRLRLGSELVALKDQPARRLTPAQINRIIDRIEEL